MVSSTRNGGQLSRQIGEHLFIMPDTCQSRLRGFNAVKNTSVMYGAGGTQGVSTKMLLWQLRLMHCKIHTLVWRLFVSQ